MRFEPVQVFRGTTSLDLVEDRSAALPQVERERAILLNPESENFICHAGNCRDVRPHLRFAPRARRPSRAPLGGATIVSVTSPAAAALAAICGLVAAVIWLIGLPRVPEPADGDDADGKVSYAALAGSRTAALVAVFSAAASWTAAINVPLAALPPWLVLSTLGVALAAVDGFTTWIPAGPTRWTWLVMAAAAASSLLVGAGWTDLLRTVAGAVVAGLLYLVLWVTTRGGFGFGDVRFVPLVAAPAAAVSVDVLLTALLIGTSLALVHGLWRHATHRPGWQPWAPTLTLGTFIAAAAMA